jgi:hypothetical protein
MVLKKEIYESAALVNRFLFPYTYVNVFNKKGGKRRCRIPTVVEKTASPFHVVPPERRGKDVPPKTF